MNHVPNSKSKKKNKLNKKSARKEIIKIKAEINDVRTEKTIDQFIAYNFLKK